MKRKAFYSSILFLFFIFACSPAATVYSDQLQGVDFNQFKTYAILPVIDTASSSLYHNAILEQNLVASIDREMTARGYTLDRENPDLLVNLHLKLKDRQETVVERYPLTSTYTYYNPQTDPALGTPVHPQLGTAIQRGSLLPAFHTHFYYLRHRNEAGRIYRRNCCG